MEIEPAELLRHALPLPLGARSALIESLIESLDNDIDENAHGVWREDVRHRIQQIDKGVVAMIPRDEARNILRGRL